MKKTFLFLAALAMSVSLSAEKITTLAGITSGNKYYVGATTGDKDYYFYVDGSAKTESIKGVAKEDVADAVALTFTAVTSGWTIQFDNGLYLGIKNAKDNGAVQVMEEPVVWTIDEDTEKGLLKLHPNDYYLQKNNSGTQFGSYKNTQTNVWLESAGAAPTPATLDSLIIKGTASKMEYETGEAFDPAGLEVWGIYTKTVKHDSTSQIKSGITWTLDPETFEEASDNASVTLVASYKELTTADTTITGIKVNEPAPLPKYATIYTSNVTLSTTGGTSATEAKVVVAKGDTVDALKAGTGSAAGVLVVNIPAATKTLHFHVVGWSGKSVELDINGEALAITSDAGISNNSPFTLKGTASDYYYAIDPKGATTITFTATKDNRFVLFGVNAELQEGVIAAPAFTPTDTDFDGSVEVTLTCETEGAEIFYALNEEVTSMNATKYTEPIKLTETTTIYAVAKKDGKESEQASKTYTLIPTYTLAELVAAGAPTADKKKVILVLENEVITGIDGTRGIYVKSGDQEIEIFCYNLPETAVKGAYVSGRAMGDWFLYGTQEPKKWELQPADWSWATFATSPTRIINPKANKVAKKAIVNGQIMIIRDSRTYNVLGF